MLATSLQPGLLQQLEVDNNRYRDSRTTRNSGRIEVNHHLEVLLTKGLWKTAGVWLARLSITLPLNLIDHRFTAVGGVYAATRNAQEAWS